MDFKIIMRCNKNACILMLAMLTWLQENAIAQSANCVVETIFSVNIQPKPTADFSFIASDLNATFSNASVNSITYAWDFGDPGSGSSNTSSEANPIHDFSSPGNYTVTLTAMNGCGSRSVTQTVQVVCPMLAVTVGANGPTVICPGEAVMLSTASGYQGYQWLLDGNPIAGGTNADLQAIEPGEYTVAVINAAGCTGLSQAVSVELLPLAEPSFSTTVSAMSASFNNNSLNSTSYSWDFGDPNAGASNTSFEANPTHDFSAPGTYLVTLTATNACGIQIATQEVVIACIPPQVSIASNGPSQFCEGGSAIIQASPTNFTAYQWYFNDLPIPSGTGPMLAVTAAGQYKVLVTDFWGCENYSDVLVVEVYPLPLVSISGLNSDYMEGDPPVPIIGTPVGGIFSGNGLAGDQFDPSAAGIGQHTIYYTYTDANNCSNKDSVVVNVSPVSATSLVGVISHIQVLPNPNHGDFWLEIVLSSNRTLNFGLMNALGQTLANRQEWLPSGQSMLHFSSNELISGVYFLKVLDGNQYNCLRFIVTN